MAAHRSTHALRDADASSERVRAARHTDRFAGHRPRPAPAPGRRRVGVERAVGEPDVRRRGADDVVAVGVHVRMPGAEDEVFPAPASIGAGLPRISERPLPEIGDAAGRRPGGHLHHEWSRFLHRRKGHDVGRGGIGGEQPELVGERDVVDVVEVAGAEGVAMLPLPFSHRRDRQRPEISLTSPLEVDGVVDAGHRRRGGVATLEFDPAGSRIERPIGGQKLRRAGRTYATSLHGRIPPSDADVVIPAYHHRPSERVRTLRIDSGKMPEALSRRSAGANVSRRHDEERIACFDFTHRG